MNTLIGALLISLMLMAYAAYRVDTLLDVAECVSQGEAVTDAEVAYAWEVCNNE